MMSKEIPITVRVTMNDAKQEYFFAQSFFAKLELIFLKYYSRVLTMT